MMRVVPWLVIIAAVCTPPAAAQTAAPATARPVVGLNTAYAYEILDPTTYANRKILRLLDHRRRDSLADDTVTLGGAVTAIMDFQGTNREGKFGYLMRHPTDANQVGGSVSEAVIHSAQVAITGTRGSWLTAHLELLYDPQQSFGEGTITGLQRNQIQLRRGFVLVGDLAQTPFYFALGKMATPFGLGDSLSPFTLSTTGHAFGGLAYGAQFGYSNERVNATFMAVQGGAQFRAANTPVDGTAVPSKLNNFVFDGHYTWDFEETGTVLFGASYERGSAYCLVFPVAHFSACEDNNPAFDVYAQFTDGALTVQAEIARTLDEWPGTFNPDMPRFPASKVTSLDVGGRYRTLVRDKPVDWSVEFSRFITGPTGAPWERQDEIVVGVAAYLLPGAKFFAEYVRVNGYVPLPFLSGGNLAPGETHSEKDGHTTVFVMGVNAAF